MRKKMIVRKRAPFLTLIGQLFARHLAQWERGRIALLTRGKSPSCAGGE